MYLPPNLPLPESLRTNIEHEFGARGVVWLDALPSLLETYAGRWALTLDAAFPDLSYSYVALATRGDGTSCVLKLSIPEPASEFIAGVECLRFWDGAGCARLLEADLEGGAVLLERLQPGTMLSELCERDDDAATEIAAGIMQTLWRPPPDGPHHLIDLRRWFADLMEHRERFGGPVRFPPALLTDAVAMTEALLTSTSDPAVLHGDLHHFNILRAERAPWLTIDAKGLVGDRCFEVAAFLRNPSPRPLPVLRRRLAILIDALGLDPQRTRDWCFAEAMLNAAWSHDAPSDEFERRLAWAELMLKL